MGQGMMNVLNPIGTFARMQLQFECLCDDPQMKDAPAHLQGSSFVLPGEQMEEVHA
jgi:hypothetical protein